MQNAAYHAYLGWMNQAKPRDHDDANFMISLYQSINNWLFLQFRNIGTENIYAPRLSTQNKPTACPSKQQ